MWYFFVSSIPEFQVIFFNFTYLKQSMVKCISISVFIFSHPDLLFGEDGIDNVLYLTAVKESIIFKILISNVHIKLLKNGHRRQMRIQM